MTEPIKYLRWQWGSEDAQGREICCYTSRKKIHIAADQTRGYAPPLCCQYGDGNSETVFHRVECLEPWELTDDKDFKEGDICLTCARIWKGAKL